MSDFDWSEEKNKFLEQTRGISFEDVIFHIQNGDVLDVIKHPNAALYPEQKIIVINIEGYVHFVPYVKEKGIRFLKTIIPSRKATKEYLE
ncbi:MAG: BrnT family toxin [Candidatus Scalindua sp.]